MDFRLEFTPKPFTVPIKHQDKLLLIGSCFTENIGTKLKNHKWDLIENPNGILFNPVSIVQSMESYINLQKYTDKDLFYHNECWHSWQHHSRFSHPDQNEALKGINTSQQSAHEFLQTADWVLITLGSSFVYTYQEQGYVANCHKIPTDKFNKVLLGADEIFSMLHDLLIKLKAFNANAKVIFTISPVRHLRDGFVENNRSKANLIAAVHKLVDVADNAFYFPAYELVIDDLRDYRFFAEDMVHPNYAATNYVWEKFISTCIDSSTVELMKQINEINAAVSHKPFNPGSEAHKKFKQSTLLKIQRLKEQYKYLDFSYEEAFFLD